jgi:hypothetical protein
MSSLKYCKVCHDLGKLESEYRSHFVRETRDPNSKITCPTLNAMECRYCFKTGHTVKFCQVLKNNKKMNQQNQKAQLQHSEKSRIEVPGVNKKVSNKFACLDEDDEEVHVEKKPLQTEKKHEQVTEPYLEEFPALCATTSNRVFSVVSPETNYAKALENSRPILKASECVPEIKLPPLFTKKASDMDWAAMDSESESESDDEDDELEKIAPAPYKCSSTMGRGWGDCFYGEEDDYEDW